MSSRTQGTALILGVHFIPLLSLYCQSFVFFFFSLKFLGHSGILAAGKMPLLSEDNS